MYCISHQYFCLETGYFSPWQQAVICNFVGLRGTTAFIAAVLLRGNARECVDCEFVEMRGTAKCVEMRGAAACVEMRVASMSPNRGSSARDTSGKHAGSAAQARLKCAEPRFHALLGPVFIRDRHTLRVKKGCNPSKCLFCWGPF